MAELFSKHSFIENTLNDNVYIIGTCNPYRLILSNDEEIFYTNQKIHRIRNLIYIVINLPLSLINYAFDFGSLRDDEEKKSFNLFIKSFLSESFLQGENKKGIYKNICQFLHNK